MNKTVHSIEKLPQAISFNTLPEAVQSLLEQVQELNQKIDNLPVAAQEPPDDNRFVDIVEIRTTVFPQWKRQTIYNKYCLGENGTLPFSRIGKKIYYRQQDIEKILSDNYVMYKIKNHERNK